VTTLQVELGARSYPIHVMSELPGPLVASEARRAVPEARAGLIVTDSNVGPRYAGGVVAALEGAGLQATLVELEPGERSKTLETVSAVLDRALETGISRRDLVVALGGGVVGDIAGFAASILHRGVAFLQVPTTLLAQVDSSVGGKTGVDHAAGKNLIGAFWQPRAVVASQAVLGTLPEREVRSGLAEAIKHAFIADAGLVAWIEAQAPRLRALEPEASIRLVLECCRIKARIVAQDEREEGGARARLNFGHTLGHALERELGYGVLTHGEAVALGMVWAARLSETLGVAEPGLARGLVEVLEGLGLPADPRAPGVPPVASVLRAARSDKKAHGGQVRFVLLSRMGESLIRPLAWDEIEQGLMAWQEEAAT
jgi:3-dehydroquinate synthase